MIERMAVEPGTTERPAFVPPPPPRDVGTHLGWGGRATIARTVHRLREEASGRGRRVLAVGARLPSTVL